MVGPRTHHENLSTTVGDILEGVLFIKGNFGIVRNFILRGSEQIQ